MAEEQIVTPEYDDEALQQQFLEERAKQHQADFEKPYDPEGDDVMIEELVAIWEAGDFPAFYFSLFWQDPPVMPIPEKYL